MESATQQLIEQINRNVNNLSLTLEGLAISVNAGFEANDRKFAAIDKRFDGLENKIDGLENRMDKFENRMDGLDARMDGLDTRMDGLYTRMLEGELRLEGRINNLAFTVQSLSEKIDTNHNDQELHRLKSRTDQLELTVGKLLQSKRTG